MTKSFEEFLPMTSLENQLKIVWNLRSDVHGRVLSSEELSNYITWLVLQYGRTAQITSASLPVRPASETLADISENILSGNENLLSLRRLGSSYGAQKEHFFFMQEQDISASRQLRYMPSHWHSNDYFEIYYTFHGNCPVIFQNSHLDTSPGTVVVVSPGVTHASPCYQDDCVLLYFLIRSSTFQKVFWNQLPSGSLMANFFRQALECQHEAAYIRFETGNDPDIAHLLSHIYQENEKDDIYKAQMLNTLMSAFFILLLRRYEHTARLPRTKDFFWKHQYSAILSYIQSNYSTLTLENLAQQYHYSPRQISRIVQDCVGISYHQLILKLRMERAAALLNQETLSIDAISQRVGYSTKSSFYRAFTSYYQCTPKEYLHRTQPQDNDRTAAE